LARIAGFTLILAIAGLLSAAAELVRGVTSEVMGESARVRRSNGGRLEWAAGLCRGLLIV
jgi:hypothetical protein